MNHIDQTLKELEAGRAEMRADLEAMDRLIAGLTAYRQLNPAASRVERQRTTETQSAKQPKAPKAERAPRQSAQTLVAKVQKLKEPFTAADLADATGLTHKAAQSAIYRWKEKEWLIAGPTFGTFQRTKTFGGASAAGNAMLAQIHAEIEAEKANKA